jgi:hypothetical protein
VRKPFEEEGVIIESKVEEGIPRFDKTFETWESGELEAMWRE